MAPRSATRRAAPSSAAAASIRIDGAGGASCFRQYRRYSRNADDPRHRWYARRHACGATRPRPGERKQHLGRAVSIAGSFTRIGVQEGASLTISGPISDGGAGHVVTFRVTSTTPGMITLSGIGNTWGETRVYGNTLRIAGADNILPIAAPLFVGTTGVGNSIVDLNGRNQEVAGVGQIGGTTNFITNRGSADSTITLSGSIDRTWNGTFQDGVTNKLALVKTGSFTQTLTGSSPHTGGTTIRGGTLNVAANGALGATGIGVTIENGAILQAGGALTTAARTFTLGAGGGQIDTNGNTINLAPGSTVTGTSLTKNGAGTLILAGTQSYAALTATGGLTELDSPLGTGTSTLTANADVNIGVSQTLASLIIGDGATVTLGATPSPADSGFEESWRRKALRPRRWHRHPVGFWGRRFRQRRGRSRAGFADRPPQRNRCALRTPTLPPPRTSLRIPTAAAVNRRRTDTVAGARAGPNKTGAELLRAGW